MLPFTVAAEIRAALLDYLVTTFNFSDPAVEAALLAFLQRPEGGLFKGPYLSLRLPFRKASAGETIPLAIRPPFTPYVHQVRSFTRLSTQDGRSPQSTLVTTGTGSGKTECFLYPILDDCYARRGQPGIKAIILYPMNALASDQAMRLARQIHGDERLRGQVRAGIYIGGEGSGRKQMGPDYLIEDRSALRSRPPDILLTNYKMLDFLLLRPEDRPLWAQNEPETLRFLVLDELHTYDGAQGSDVACLVRRLKARLGSPEGHVVPVGTSATVAGDDEDSRRRLLEFATEVFGQPFADDAIIGEERLTAAEFLAAATTATDLPAATDGLDEQPGESYEAFLDRQMRLWFGRPLDPFALAGALAGHVFLRSLLAATGSGVISWSELAARLSRRDVDFGARTEKDRQALLGSFLALVAHARVEPEGPLPFLTLQAQLWVREMSRLMRTVAPTPGFFWRDDVPPGAMPRGLPAYFCRECGHSGWLALRYDGDDALTDDHRRIYEAYFNHSKNVRYVYPGAPPGALPGTGERLCPTCLGLTTAETCPRCRRPAFPVVAYRAVGEPGPNRPPQDLQRCPVCGTDDALSIVGSQSASLSSVAVSHLFTSPLNSDKKLLAFTDSVQDAAHRAAFFGARTYRFSIRTAIQTALPAEAPVRLSDLPDRVLEYWQERWQEHPRRHQHLTATLLPPDLSGLPAYRRYLDEDDGPMPADVSGPLHKRLAWEVTSEYGFNARLGRSLEKAGSSTAYLDPGLLDVVCARLEQILPEEFASLRRLPPAALRHFVLGLVERTRVRGGVVHPLLVAYAKDQGNWYQLTKRQQPLLSPFHKHSPRYPKFLTDTAQRRVFDVFLATRPRQTWHLDWAQRTLSTALGIDEINDVYRRVVQALVETGILRPFPGGQATAYGIEPAALLVTSAVTGVQCSICGHKQTAALAAGPAAWIGQPCLSYECPGRYVEDTGFGQHYYRALYGRGQVERVFPHEHTGLLDRTTRETVEKAFSSQNRADAANLLAATPTLELGIDIGDLSATMACSVPPAPANYLQRIGRAGRKTGNSLILTLANAIPHDLYFFEQPLEMIAGGIAPPGCFLNAPSMLERQFLAFSMDVWTASQPTATSLPRTVKDMLAGMGRGGFPEDLLAFYDRERSVLCERFLSLFDEQLSTDSRDTLRSYAAGDVLPRRIREALAAADAERKQLREANRLLRQQLKEVQDDLAQYANPDAKIKELQREIRLLLDLVRSIEDKYVLNFFTDAGLLPNYAFPETGVELRAIVTGIETTDATDHAYAVHEYLRPASVALRELAPFNSFYAEGRKLEVTHVNLPVQGGSAEIWQFCDRCSHLELVQTHHYNTTCPVCGSPGWADGAQKRQMVRFRRATSWTEHYASLIGDDADERERKSYVTGHFFDIRPEHSTGAHYLPGLPFGIEYLNQVTLREVNFAEAPFMGQDIRIADEERPGHGYRICKGCGVVSPAPPGHEPGQLHHQANCPHAVGEGSWLDAYLYREMTSEALRLLLPVATVLTAEKLATFEACLDLGLRRKFRGDPDHLEIRSHSEPAAEGGRRLFLVVYDTVPGGTSFLKDLAKPAAFREVLELALEVLGTCTCRLDPDKQACYRCLYSYRGQHDLALISRQLGIEMLGEILKAWDTLQPIPTLSDVHIDSLVESELEQGFVNALKALADKTQGYTWTPLLHNGRLAWELGLGERRWLIEPQVDLNAARGVAVASRADFVLWPLGPGAKEARPVAVYTDGYAYHACPTAAQGRVADDLRKRQAVAKSGKFVVWTVTWDDVAEFSDGEPFAVPFLEPAQQQMLQQMLATQTNLLPRTLARENAVSQLVAYLLRPEFQRWADHAAALGVAFLAPPRPPVGAPLVDQVAQHLLADPVVGVIGMPRDAPPGDQLYGIVQRSALHLLASIPQQATKPDQAGKALRLVLRLDDDLGHRSEETFRKPWRQFWLLHNLWQFLPGLETATTELIGSAGPASPTLVTEVEAAASVDPAWNEASAFADPVCGDLLAACRQAGVPAPLVGYELTDEQGRIVASAELAWPDHRLAIFLTGTEADQDRFTGAGWQPFAPTDAGSIVSALVV